MRSSFPCAAWSRLTRPQRAAALARLVSASTRPAPATSAPMAFLMRSHTTCPSRSPRSSIRSALRAASISASTPCCFSSRLEACRIDGRQFGGELLMRLRFRCAVFSVLRKTDATVGAQVASFGRNRAFRRVWQKPASAFGAGRLLPLVWAAPIGERDEGFGLARHRRYPLRHVPDPKIEDQRDAIAKVTSCAICGSDLHLFDNLMSGMKKGDIMGHETMGEVVDVGTGAKGKFNTACADYRDRSGFPKGLEAARRAARPAPRQVSAVPAESE